MFILFVIIAYFLGCFSMSILLGRRAGVDIKKEGSGNAGTTNTLRVLGKKAAAMVLLCDVAKGVIAVLLGRIAGVNCAYACAIFVFAGHIWPAFYGFKGGKGVATAFGACLAVNWKIALLCLAVVVIVTLITKRMSAGSLCGALALPVLSVFIERPFWPYAAAIAIVILIKHRSNIQRLVKGEEPPISFKK